MELFNGILCAMEPVNLFYGFIGCLVGTMVGVLPGLGPVSAVAILFPFTTYLPPTGAIIALCAIYYGAMYGGSTTSILMNVPGETSSVVTCLDGFQMTKQGRAGPALAIAAIGSFEAGIVGSLVIAFLGPFIAHFALDFGPAEYLGLGLFSLTAIAALAGKSLTKGVIVSVVGMLLASVGMDMASTVCRLTFGRIELLQGLVIVPLTIGLFGFGEMLSAIQENTKLISGGKLGKLMPSRQELKDGLAASTRATALAVPMGLFPGMQPSIITFIAYSVERQRSKNPERFGKGAIEGVASAEAANNAAAMGNIVPLLSLGVPTGPTMALVLAALTMYGLIPGPLLFTQNTAFAWTVIGSFFVANCMLLVLNLPLVGIWARFSIIPYPILAPTILAVCVVGSYSIRSSILDVGLVIVFGILGWVMRKGGWPSAPMVLGFILGPMVEQSARQVMDLSPALLLERPVFWAFIVMGILAIRFSRRLT